MDILLTAVAVLVGAGGVVAMVAPAGRLAFMGAAVAIAGAGFVADPLPGPGALLAGVASAALAAYLGWVAQRAAPTPLPATPLDRRPVPAWPGAAGVAIAAFLAGWLTATAVGRALSGPVEGGPSLSDVAAALTAGSLVARAGLGAAFALIAVAAGQVVIGRDILRLGLGLLLLIAAVQILRAALGGSGDMVAFAFAMLYAVGGAGVAALIGRSLAVHGDLEFRDRESSAVRSRTVDEAIHGGPLR